MHFKNFYKSAYLDIKNLRKIEIGEKLFNLGILFLPWAVPIGLFFLLVSLLISISKNYRELIKDKSNYLIFIVSFLMIFNSIKQNIYLSKSIEFDFDSGIYLGLFNWIPLFLAFLCFKYYLRSALQRSTFARNLIIGSIPVLISCIFQKWFGWESPIVIFKGLIIWFQKPLLSDSGVSGLFSNPNYTGFWLVSIWPFSLYFLTKFRGKFIKTLSFLLVSTIFYLTILSGSRNAFLGIIISSLLLLKVKLLILFITIFFIMIFLNHILISISHESVSFLDQILPKQLLSKIKINLNLDLLQYQRIEIWNKTLQFIAKKPLLGWGASTFPVVYIFFQGLSDAQHAHNIFLQLAYDYGLLVSIFIAIIIYNLFSSSIKFFLEINKSMHSIDTFWIVSALIAVLFHQLDFPYYDIRISMLFWILLSGLKGINEYKKIKIR